MPTYNITGPDGKNYSIDGPAGATKEQVVRAIMAKMQQPQATSSALGAAARGLERGIIPTVVGLAGAGVGAVAGLPGAIAGGMGAGYGAEKLQEKALEEFPRVAKFLGQDPAQREADEREHPIAATVGEVGASLPFFRPSLTALKSAAGKAEEEAREIYTARKLAAVNAGIGGATDVAQQKLEGGKDIDWGSAAESALLGGALSHETPLGKKVFGLGERLTKRPSAPTAKPGAVMPDTAKEAAEPTFHDAWQPPPPPPAEPTQLSLPLDEPRQPGQQLQLPLQEPAEPPPRQQGQQLNLPLGARQQDLPLVGGTANPPQDPEFREGDMFNQGAREYSVVPPKDRKPTQLELPFYKKGQQELDLGMPSRPSQGTLPLEEPEERPSKQQGQQLELPLRSGYQTTPLRRPPPPEPYQLPLPLPGGEYRPTPEREDDLFNRSPRQYSIIPPKEENPPEQLALASALPFEKGSKYFKANKANNRNNVLDYLTATDKPVSAKDIATNTNIKQTELIGHLNTLKNTGAIEYNPDTKKWNVVKPAEGQANGTEPARPAGADPRTDIGRSGRSVEMPVQQRAPNVDLPFEAQPSGVGSGVAAAGRPAVAEEAASPALKEHIPGSLATEPEKEDPALGLARKRVVDRAMRAFRSGNLSEDHLMEIREELNSYNPNFAYLHDLIDAATKLPKPDEKPVPVLSTPDKKEWLQKQDVQKASGDELLKIAEQAHELGLIDGPTFSKIYGEAANEEPNLRKIRNWITGERAVRTSTPVPRASTGATESVEEFMARRAKETAETSQKPASTQAAEPSIEERIKQSRAGLKLLTSDNPGQGMRWQDAEDVVKNETSDWTNRPKIAIHQDHTTVPKHLGLPSNARGAFDSRDNTVHLIAGNHANATDLKFTLFHEALGHYGLANKFGRHVDALMNYIHNSNPKIREAVSKWIDTHKNDDFYRNLTPGQKRAIGTEEVLANISGKGPIKDPGILGAINRVVAATRMWARKNLGWAIKFSSNDIIHMLRDVHESVRSGKNTENMGKGVKLSDDILNRLPKDSARIERMIEQLHDDHANKKISLDEFLARLRPLNDQRYKVEKEARIKAGKGVSKEIFPGFKKIPVGTEVTATHGLAITEPTRAKVVGTSVMQLMDGVYQLPLVKFNGRNETRTLLPHNIQEVHAPRSVKLSAPPQAKTYTILHGGDNFDKPDRNWLGRGEPGNIRPLGNGLYGYVVKTPEDVKNAHRWLQNYSNYARGQSTIHAFQLPISPGELAYHGSEPFDEYLKSPEGQYEKDKAAGKRWKTRTGDSDYPVHSENLPIGVSEVAVHDFNRLSRIGKWSADISHEDLTKELDKLGVFDNHSPVKLSAPPQVKQAAPLQEETLDDVERNINSGQQKYYREQETKQGVIKTVINQLKTSAYNFKEEAIRLLQDQFRPLFTLSRQIREAGGDTELDSLISGRSGKAEMFGKPAQLLHEELSAEISKHAEALGMNTSDTLKRLNTYAIARHEPERRHMFWLKSVPLENTKQISIPDHNGNTITGTAADIRKKIWDKYQTEDRVIPEKEYTHDRQILETLANNYADKDGFSPLKSSKTPRSMSIEKSSRTYNVAGNFSDKAMQLIKDGYADAYKNHGPAIDKMFELAEQLHKETNNLKRNSGMLSQKTDNIMNLYDFKNYMPLKGDPSNNKSVEMFNRNNDKNVSGDYSQAQKGFGGRQTYSENPFLQTMADAHRAANVYGSYGITQEMAKLIKSGMVEGKLFGTIKFADRDTELENKKWYGRSMFFNHLPNGDIQVYKLRDPKIAEALKGFTADVGGFWRGLNWINSTIGQLHTRFNPAFPPYNFVRHAITSAGFVGTDYGLTNELKFIGRVTSKIIDGGLFKGLKAARMYHAGDLKGLADLASKDPFYKDIHEYLINGGRATYTHSLNIVKAEKDLAKVVSPNGFLTSVRHVRQYFDIWSDMFEFAGRAAGYGAVKDFETNAAREAGKDITNKDVQQQIKQKAMGYTKNLFNYEKVGKYGREAGALFMFLRPAMTTAVRALDAIGPALGGVDKALTRLSPGLINPEVIAKKQVLPKMALAGQNIKDEAVKAKALEEAKQISEQNKDTYRKHYISKQKNARLIALATMGAGIFLYKMAELAGEQDEQGRNKVATDNMEMWSRNIRLPAHGVLGKGNDYFQIPWGWGLGAFGSFGAQMGGVMFGESSLKEAIFNTIPVALESYLPIPAPKYSPLDHPLAFTIGSVTPTFVRPFIEYGFNVDEFGREIYKDRMSQFGDAYSGGENLPELYGAASRTLADATNGSISIEPNTLHFFANSYLDGLARIAHNTYGSALTVAGQKDFDPKQDLGGIADSFIGKSSSYDSREYQDFKAKIQRQQGVLKMYRDHPEQYDRYIESHPNAEMIDSLYNSLENGALKQVRAQLNSIRDDTSISPKDKADQIKELQVQRDMLIRSFLDEVKDYE